MDATKNPEPKNFSQRNMALKVCGMREKQNIGAILALQPDYLGFIFYPESTRFVGDQLSEETISLIPAGTKKVGVFVNETHEKIEQTVKAYKLEAVQLHGDESPELCRQLSTIDLEVLKAFSVDDAFDFNILEAYEGTCDFYLFDTKGKEHGGNGLRFNWDILNHYTGDTPFFLSGGIDLEHVAQIKSLPFPLLQGIDINSRFETRPALKDTAKVSKFFQQIRQF